MTAEQWRQADVEMRRALGEAMVSVTPGAENDPKVRVREIVGVLLYRWPLPDADDDIDRWAGRLVGAARAVAKAEG